MGRSKQKRFTLGKMYYFTCNNEVLYIPVRTLNYGVAAQVWRLGYTGRPYMIGLETVVLTSDMRLDMQELGARHVEPRTPAGEVADLLLTRNYWLTRAIYGGHS